MSHPPVRRAALRARTSALAAGLLAAALLPGCEPDAPEGAPVEAPVETGPPAAEEGSPFDGIELPPFEPLPLSPPMLEPPPPVPPPERHAAALEREALAREGDAQASAGDDATSPSMPPLDVLLRTPDRRPPPGEERPSFLDLEASSEPKARAPTLAPGPIDRLRERVHLERRSEPIGPKGPRQGTRSETDAGIRVPLDEGVHLEGGVRVDERDEPGAEAPERKSTPRVGVEWQF